MNTHNFESTTIVGVHDQSEKIVENTLSDETDQVRRETQSLIDLIKKRAEVEAKSASTLTRETYLNAVRRAKSAMESSPTIPQDGLERAWMVLQAEVERNWYLLMKETIDFGYRCQNAVKAGWEAFNQTHHQN